MANFVRLSLRKGAFAVLSNAAWQEIRVRFGRDDNFVAKTEISSRIFDCKTNLSSRPKRSEVEGPAVKASSSNRDPARGIDYPSLVIEISPAEYKSVKREGQVRLGNHVWEIGEEVQRA